MELRRRYLAQHTEGSASLRCHHGMGFGDAPIRNRAWSAGHQRTHSVGAVCDALRIPVLVQAVYKGGRESVACAHRVSYRDVIAGSLAIFAVFEDGAAALAEGHAHGPAAESIGPAAAEILDRVARTF